jgi:hypothetical protein
MSLSSHRPPTDAAHLVAQAISALAAKHRKAGRIN